MNKDVDKSLGKDTPAGSEEAAKKSRTGKKSRFKGRRPQGTGKKPYIGPNDIKWRAGSNNLLTKLAANIPFGFPLGHPIPMNDASVYGKHLFIPGIMAIKTQITLGNATDYNSPINIVAREVYSYVRHANSGSKNYDAIDLALYFGAMGQIIAFTGWLQRVYNTICHFDLTNRYTPEALIKAQDVDYDDIKKHQAELAWFISYLGHAVNSFALPKMPYFDACYQAYSRYYTDSDSCKPQIYTFVPYGFFKYNPVKSEAGGGLDSIEWVAPFNYENLVAIGDELLSVLRGDYDIGLFSGDILKAYGEGNLFKMESQGIDQFGLTKEVEILEQIHNLTLSPFEVSGYSSNAGTAATAPFLTADVTYGAMGAANAHYDQSIFDVFSDNPDPEEVINASVLKVSAQYTVSGSAYAWVQGSEVFDFFNPVVVQVYMLNDSGVLKSSAVTTLVFGKIVAIASSDYILTNFDWHPIRPFATTFAGSQCTIALGDLHNTTLLDHAFMKRLKETCTLNMFNYTQSVATKG